MSIPIATERSLLSHDEFEIVKATHFPALMDLPPDALNEARKDLRQRRDKERAISRRRRRARQERSGAREVSPDGEMPNVARRKQVFAQALKRLNQEARRQKVAEAREEMMRSARRALEMRRTLRHVRHPSSGRTADAGMTAKASPRGHPGVIGAKVGSVSQQTKTAQARRDARSAR